MPQSEGAASLHARAQHVEVVPPLAQHYVAAMEEIVGSEPATDVGLAHIVDVGAPAVDDPSGVAP